MSSYHYVFARPVADAPDLVARLGNLLGTQFKRVDFEYADYMGTFHRVAIDVSLSHDFGMNEEDEDEELPLSRYPLCVTFRDLDKNEERQERTARHVFEALKSSNTYALLLVFDLQQLLGAYTPEGITGSR
ncbi:hypothetical protein TH66_05245 [Carbonactinospora thermoautotrophica]|uniref:Uncharacterized protein n=1 Tax=Carbonactinospora thermoautotrophica TaxID=1469144 RepID=A0A132NJP4_9ACTN|nr:hypothetical protein [Carbonactinospora thermoautotrophica]KWW99048.1 hypothetical protein LI90_680 [Carbonactinospora thermoautotrophica]KWX05126.1 hypothetical protein TH66_05245 [Carbonactinospora thermoautotrophica]KWX10245.1 hypothetical protein TR74_04795 [Carbonactinospora thermoautotrophica]